MRTRKITLAEVRASTQNHIITGDRGDGVPNIFSPDASLVSGRQTKATAKRKDAIIACATPDDIEDPVVRRNYYRNLVLVDLQHTPKDIKADIISQYESKKDGAGLRRMKVFNYLVSKQLLELSSKAADF